MIKIDIFLDKETLPPLYSDEQLVAFKNNLKVPANITKSDSKIKWVEENWEEKYRKLALNTAICNIATFAFNFNKTKTKCFINNDRDDELMLKMFYEELRNFAIDSSQKEGMELTEEDFENDEFMRAIPIRWIGVNIRNFDLDILWKKAIKYKLYKLARLIPRKKYDPNVIDLAEVFNGPRTHEYTSQSEIAALFDIKGKPDDIDGSKVYDYWMQGQQEKVAEYNIFDVDTTIVIFDLLVGNLQE